MELTFENKQDMLLKKLQELLDRQEQILDEILEINKQEENDNINQEVKKDESY